MRMFGNLFKKKRMSDEEFERKIREATAKFENSTTFQEAQKGLDAYLEKIERAKRDDSVPSNSKFPDMVDLSGPIDEDYLKAVLGDEPTGDADLDAYRKSKKDLRMRVLELEEDMY